MLQCKPSDEFYSFKGAVVKETYDYKIAVPFAINARNRLIRSYRIYPVSLMELYRQENEVLLHIEKVEAHDENSDLVWYMLTLNTENGLGQPQYRLMYVVDTELIDYAVLGWFEMMIQHFLVYLEASEEMSLHLRQLFIEQLELVREVINENTSISTTFDHIYVEKSGPFTI